MYKIIIVLSSILLYAYENLNLICWNPVYKTMSTCCRSSTPVALWSGGAQTSMRLIPPVRQSLLAQVSRHYLETQYSHLTFGLVISHCLLCLFRFMVPASSLDAGPSHPYDKMEAQLPSSLLEELFGITLLIGRLKDLPANIQSAFNMSNQGKVYKTSIDLFFSFFYFTTQSFHH